MCNSKDQQNTDPLEYNATDDNVNHDKEEILNTTEEINAAI
jgi:hypothetical protein